MKNGVLGVPAIPLAAVAATGLVLAVGAWILHNRRRSPAELERKRRRGVGARGRMAGATVVDLCEDELFYSYTVGGAHYTASQDISALRDRLPAGPHSLLGPATVKYDPANPANSILISEDWSGVRNAPGSGSEGERTPV